MTREKAIKALERADNYVGIHYINGVEDTYINPHLKEAIKVALTALRPVSRERVEKMRSRWVPLNNTQEHFCESCGVAFNLYAYCRNDYQFCPSCGAPMTDEAVEMVMERLEALRDE